MPPPSLTVKEKIQLHLFEFSRAADAYEVPEEVTQEGIARTVGIRVHHVQQYVRPLIAEGLVDERTSHIRRQPRRRKAYFLTERGRSRALTLRTATLKEPVPLRTADGQTLMLPLGRILEERRRGARPADLVRELENLGYVAEVVAPEQAGTVEILADSPRVERFVGRRRELEIVTADEEAPRVFVVRGVAGIGKSTFAAKACELLRGTRNLCWHRVQAWDTPQTLFAALGRFLFALGRPGLRTIIEKGEVDRTPEVLRETLPGTRSFLVFDDAHEAGPEALPFFRVLKDAVANAPDVRLLVATRRALAFYDRRDVQLGGLVAEVDLQGLGSEEIAALLASSPSGGVLADIGRKLGGHPLFLRLLESASRPELAPHALADIRRFIEESIYAELTGDERLAMKVASLYRVPVPRDALLPPEAGSYDVLLSLTNRSLINPTGEDLYEAHDTVREFFAGILTPSERQTFARFAGDHLRALTAKCREAGDFLACIRYVSNALELADSDEDRAVLKEALGELNERVGDLPSALIAWREAAKRTSDPEVLARLHRKAAAACEARGQWTPASREVETGLDALGSVRSIERAWLHLVQARIAERTEELEEAREHGGAALSLFQAFGSPLGEAHALRILGWAETVSPRGDPASAEARLRSALDLAESLGDPALVAALHTSLAYLFAYRIGDASRSREHFAAAEAIPEGQWDPHTRRTLLMAKGWFHLEVLADFAVSESYFREALSFGRRIYDAAAVAFARYGLAYIAFYQGRFGDARRMLAEILPEIRQPAFLQWAVEATCTVAECCLLENDLDGFRTAARTLEDPGLTRGVEARASMVDATRGLLHVVGGDTDGAMRAFRAAIEASSRAFEADRPFPHLAYGASLDALGRTAEARAEIDRARELCEAQSQRARLLSVPGRARALADALRNAPRQT
ncbi:MAG TPA: hypothetical protein VII27_06955 [Thermoplasmata archaeon]